MKHPQKQILIDHKKCTDTYTTTGICIGAFFRLLTGSYFISRNCLSQKST